MPGCSYLVTIVTSFEFRVFVISGEFSVGLSVHAKRPSGRKTTGEAKLSCYHRSRKASDA